MPAQPGAGDRAPAATGPSRPGAAAGSHPDVVPAAGGRQRARTSVALAGPATSAPGVPQVRAALAEGRYRDAIALADALATASPMLSATHYLRGLALVNLGLDAEALVALRKAVYLDPVSGLAHFLLAGTLARTGDAAAARREYAAAAASLSPREATAPELGGRDLRELVALCRRLSLPPEESA